MEYVDVILPLKLSWAPVYKTELPVSAGTRVLVVFARREYVAVVWHLGVTPQVDESRIQRVAGLATDLHDVSSEEIRFWEFLSSYYLCSIGEVYKAAYPMMKLRSEQTAASVAARAMEARERSREAAVANVRKRIERLEQRLSVRAAALESRRTKAVSGRLNADVSRRLEGECSALESEIAEAERHLERLLQPSPEPLSDKPGQECRPHPAPGRPLVLYASDRVSKYVSFIRRALDEGRQALVLTPEKAFMKALEGPLSQEFGDSLLLFSSDFSAPRRRKVADALREGPAVVLGTRSALFLPFHDLGAVVVDEEQDTSHKQTEPSPRLHARDAALALSGIHCARVMLGTAAPSLETYANCISGKYDMERGALVRPDVELVDVAAERPKHGMVGALSRRLIRAVNDTGGSVVLVRCWEKPEDLPIGDIWPDEADRERISVKTLPELKRDGAGGASLVCVLQADAFVSRDDFRSDERAVQLMSELSVLAPSLLVQTAVPERFNGSRDLELLLSERKVFGLPPYTRLIDILVGDDRPERLLSLSTQLSRLLGAPALSVSPALVRIRVTVRRDASQRLRRVQISETVRDFEQSHSYQGHIVIDVDPL